MFAALGLSHWIERQTGWSIKKFVRTARRYRTVQIRAGQQINTAADLLPENLRHALAKITSPDSAHEFGQSRVSVAGHDFALGEGRRAANGDTF